MIAEEHPDLRRVVCLEPHPDNFRLLTHNLAPFAARVTPPAVRHRGCDRCSLLNLCLPGVIVGPRVGTIDPTDSRNFATAPE